MPRIRGLLTRILAATPKFHRLTERTSGVLALLLILALAGIIFYPRYTLFTLEARSEKLIVEVMDEVLAEWQFDRLTLTRDPFDPEDRLELADSTLLIEPGTEIEFNRSLHGPLYLVLRAANGDTAGLILDPSGRRIELGSWSSLRVETPHTDKTAEGRPLLLPFRGFVDLGDDVTTGVTGVLLEGKVQIAEEELLGNTRYVVNVTTVDRGDRIRLFDRDPDGPAIVEGFVRVGLDEALQIVAHGPADHVLVQRLGSGGYTITASIWRRIMQEPLLASLIVLIGILGAALGALSALDKLFRSRSNATAHGGDQDVE